LIGAQIDGNYIQQFGPLSMDFELSGCVCSNIQIRSVQLVNCDRSVVPVKWLRYITTADSYLIKLVWVLRRLDRWTEFGSRCTSQL